MNQKTIKRKLEKFIKDRNSPALRVIWKDTAAPKLPDNASWCSLADAKGFTLADIYSIGYAIRSDAEQLTLAASMSNDDAIDGNVVTTVCDVVAIPWGCITKVDFLKGS